MGPLLNAHRLFFDDQDKIVDTIEVWYNNWGTLYILAGIFYLPVIFLLKYLLRNAPPLHFIRYWVIIHNIAFCIFSTIATIELSSVVFGSISVSNWNFHHTVCDGWFLDYPESHWLHLFALSKLIELLESVYLILEKKPLNFLHWYHHFVTYTFTIYSLILNNPCSLYYSYMNLVVHAVMYFYYSIAKITSRRLSWGIVVTVLQIVQMFIGVFITIEQFYCEPPIK